MCDKTYNGWSNYETWKVNLEIYGDTDWSDYGPFQDIGSFADHLRDDLDQLLDDTSGNGLAENLARSFVSDVNWYELAESYATDYPEIIEPTLEECPECSGTGEVPDETDDTANTWTDCDYCEGSGEISIPWSPES